MSCPTPAPKAPRLYLRALRPSDDRARVAALLPGASDACVLAFLDGRLVGAADGGRIGIDPAVPGGEVAAALRGLDGDGRFR